MKLPRVRFTVRRLMVAVAILALVLATIIKPLWDGVRTARLVRYHRKQADHYLKRLLATGLQDLDTADDVQWNLQKQYLFHSTRAAILSRSPWLP
jgi:hypothetical protein